MFKHKFEAYLTVGIIFLFTLLNFGLLGNTQIPLLSILLSGITYILTVYLFYGIARLAYFKYTYLLWISGIGAFVLGYMFTGINGIWTLLTAWSMIMFASIITGRLTLKEWPQLKIYLVAATTIVLFSIMMYYTYLIDYISFSTELVNSILADLKTYLEISNSSAAETSEFMAQATRLFNMTARIGPALIILSYVMQFSLGYFMFVHFTGKYELKKSLLPSFIYWKMPFAGMIVLLLAIPMRLFADEPLVLIADNIIVFMTVFYSITGLAIMEFYLRKFKMTKFMRVLFYLMLFFSQLIGFLVAALLGFIDSFTDWRKAQQLSFSKE